MILVIQVYSRSVWLHQFCCCGFASVGASPSIPSIPSRFESHKENTSSIYLVHALHVLFMLLHAFFMSLICLACWPRIPHSSASLTSLAHWLTYCICFILSLNFLFFGVTHVFIWLCNTDDSIPCICKSFLKC